MTEEQAYKKLSRILDIYEKIPARDYGGVDGGDKKLGRLLDKAFERLDRAHYYLSVKLGHSCMSKKEKEKTLKEIK